MNHKVTRTHRANGKRVMTITPEQEAVLREYAEAHGRGWKRSLGQDWITASVPGPLQALRNSHGPSWLANYRLPILAPVVLTPEIAGLVLAVVEDDGHSLLAIEAIPEGPAREWVRKFVRTHKSDPKRGPKAVIFGQDGEVLESVEGFYTLDVLRGMASELGCVYMDSYGRGTEARRATEAIRAKLMPPVGH